MEIKNNENKNTPLILNRNRSTGDLIEKENSYKNNFIPDYRMEQYLNEYYNYLYSTKDSEKDNNSSNTNTIITNKNKSNNISNITNSKNNSIIDNKKYNNNFSINNTTLNLPDDLLIEYNNRKRLEELRKKYLSSSSLRFLRKKDEIKKEENKQKEKIDKKENIIISNIKEEKNREDDLKNVILDLKLKYDKLLKAFNILSENKNKNKEDDINRNINRKEKNIDINKDTYKNMYKNFLIEENNELKNINNNYEIILEMLISYINETNKLYFNFDQIEYFNLKQNIYNKKTKCINELSDFLKKCKENLENNIIKKDFNYDKIKFREKNIVSSFNNMSKCNKNKNKMRYTYSTQSFRNKYDNDSNYSRREKCRSKTINKTRNNKNKRTRINLVKTKNINKK